MPIEFNYLNNFIRITDFSHSSDDVIGGNPYNTTFNLTVVSGAFAGSGEFECDIKDFIRFTTQLEDLYHFRSSEAELIDICFEGTLQFSLYKTGQLNISGRICNPPHMLEFEFEADQTSLPDFTRGIMEIIELKTTYGGK